MSASPCTSAGQSLPCVRSVGSDHRHKASFPAFLSLRGAELARSLQNPEAWGLTRHETASTVLAHRLVSVLRGGGGQFRKAVHAFALFTPSERQAVFFSRHKAETCSKASY